MRVKFLCRTAPQKGRSRAKLHKKHFTIVWWCDGQDMQLGGRAVACCAAIVKDLVTVSSLAVSFTAVANCAIGNLSYLAICNGQMSGNWAPYPERRLLKERRSREQSALNDWPSSRIIVQ
jgi:hypothetical protein